MPLRDPLSRKGLRACMGLWSRSIWVQAQDPPLLAGDLERDVTFLCFLSSLIFQMGSRMMSTLKSCSEVADPIKTENVP